MELTRSQVDQEDDQLRKHPKYKTFLQEMENCLATFGQSTQWPDLVNCLQRLNRVLQRFQMIALVPEKLTLSKRLAQCCNPSLPSGVHLKVLETYGIVFQRIGNARLAADLHLYSTGFFPLFQSSSTQPKPMVLNLFQQYIIPLKHELVPSLNGLVLALLPGLEEEGSEFYDPVLKMLDTLRVSLGVGENAVRQSQRLFFRAMWRALLVAPQVRLCALHYLLARLPRESQELEFEIYIPEASTTVLRALLVALQDANVLVQRGALDVLQSHFSLDSCLFTGKDLQELLLAAFGLFTRREMALTRRVFSWLLGPQTAEDVDLVYFDKHVRSSLIPALQSMLEAGGGTRVYRIMAVLLEKETVGSAIVADLVVPMIQGLHTQRAGKETTPAREVEQQMSAARVLFGQLSQEVVWRCLQNLFLSTWAAGDDVPEVVELLTFCLELLPMDEDYVRSKYLPQLLLAMFESLKDSTGIAYFPAVVACLSFSLRVCPEIKFRHTIDSMSAVLDSLHAFFVRFVKEFCSTSSVFSRSEDEAIASVLESLSASLLQLHSAFPTQVPGLQAVARAGSPVSPAADGGGSRVAAVAEVPQWFASMILCCQARSFYASCTGISMLLAMQSLHPQLDVDANILKRIAQKLWQCMASSQHSRRAMELLLHLQALRPDTVASVVADALLLPSPSRSANYLLFGVLWRAAVTQVLRVTSPTRPVPSRRWPFVEGLMLVFDGLTDSDPSVRLACRSWLSEAMLLSFSSVVDPLLAHLLQVYATTVGLYDSGRVLYAFERLTVMFRTHMSTVMRLAPHTTASAHMLQLHRLQHACFQSATCDAAGETWVAIPSLPSPCDYVSLLVAISFRYVDGCQPDYLSSSASASSPDIAQGDEKRRSSIRRRKTVTGDDASSIAVAVEDAYLPVVRAAAAEFLQLLVANSSGAKAVQVATLVAKPLIMQLSNAIAPREDVTMQVHLLTLLRSVQAQLETQPGGGLTSNEYANPFLQVLLLGLEASYGKGAFATQQWVVFATECLSYPHAKLSSVAIPVIARLCTFVQNTCPIEYDEASSEELLLCLDGIGAVLRHCVGAAGGSSSHHHERLPGDAKKSQKWGSFMRDVFSSNSTSSPGTISLSSKSTHEQQNRAAIFQNLNSILEAAFLAWGPASSSASSAAVADDDARDSRTLTHRNDPDASSSSTPATSSPFTPSRLPAGRGSVDESEERRAMHRESKETLRRDSLAPGPIPAVGLGPDRRQNMRMVQEGILQLLAPIIREFPKELVHALLLVWDKSALIPSSSSLTIREQRLAQRAVLLEVVCSLEGATPELIVGCVCELLVTAKRKNRRRRDGISRSQTKSKFSEVPSLLFLSAYAQRCASPARLRLALLPFFAVVKEALNNSDYPPTFLLLMRSLDTLGCRGGRPEDRSTQKALQETTQQLVTTCLGVCSTSPDIQTKVHRAFLLSHNITDPNTKMDATAARQLEVKLSDYSLQALTLLAEVLARMLDSLYGDEKDRSLPLVVATREHMLPIVKNRSLGNRQHAQAAAAVLASFCEYPYTFRAWRREVWADAFQDGDFFLMDRPTLAHWRRLLDIVVSQERTAMTELMSGRPAGTQMQMFMSKDADIQYRARTMKRLAFVLLCGELDQYLPSLAAIQEKIVDALKLANAVPLFVQVFFCLRVLALRVSAQHLTPFWPVVLTEMIRVLSKPKDVNLVFAAMKFLDIMLVLQIGDFQIHEWMFISETATELSGEASFTALLDSMASTEEPPAFHHEPQDLRRPFLLTKSPPPLSELAVAAAHMRTYARHHALSSSIDSEFLDHLLECEFAEYEDDVQDEHKSPPRARRATETISDDLQRPGVQAEPSGGIGGIGNMDDDDDDDDDDEDVDEEEEFEGDEEGGGEGEGGLGDVGGGAGVGKHGDATAEHASESGSMCVTP